MYVLISMKRILSYILIALIAVFGLSCSTTRSLQEGEYRLAKNKVEITNSKEFNPNILSPYLKQKHSGWSPFQYVYNWTNGKDKLWDRFVKKIGIPPVVYNPDMVDNSIENMTNHLEYLGYYGSVVTSHIKVKRRNVSVTYNVSLGKQFPIKDIEIILPDNDEMCCIFTNKKFSLFEFDTVTVVTRLLEGDFINYKAAVPNNQPIALRLDKSELIRAVERVSIIISERLKTPVRCLFEGTTLKLTCITSMGKSYDELIIPQCSETVEIGFNNSYNFCRWVCYFSYIFNIVFKGI